MGQLIRRDGHTLVFYFYLLGVQYNGDLASRLCVSNRVGEQIGQDFFKAFLRRMDRALSLYAESKVDCFLSVSYWFHIRVLSYQCCNTYPNEMEAIL